MARKVKTDNTIRINTAKYDKWLLIEHTDFEINNKFKKAIMFTIADAADDEVEYIERDIYSRSNYFTATDDYDDIIHNLSKKGYILFKHIKSILRPNSNYVVLNTEDVKSVINDKYNQNASKYIQELINANLIAKCKNARQKNTYTINHNLFFKGSYNKFIHTYNKIYNDNDNKLNENI